MTMSSPLHLLAQQVTAVQCGVRQTLPLLSLAVSASAITIYLKSVHEKVKNFVRQTAVLCPPLFCLGCATLVHPVLLLLHLLLLRIFGVGCRIVTY
ncbi:hypothetical protein ARMGADRAFT_683176 [Armillaria gallica]|uniref:Uncharacterized protein n=1 Tax=Armillaria gallica TaxID=47427 RepID=A0A2H3CMB2_ARMGA|nr:hypothetical protein ARMGADRAFT_683176 [Armillaria gallica]